MDNDLYNLLGLAYAAKMLNKGSLANIKASFVAAAAEPGFVTAARDKLAQLETMEKQMAKSGVHYRDRDVIGATQLDFLRDALSAV